MATPTWQPRPVPSAGGVQQPSVAGPQGHWGAPGTNSTQGQGQPRPPYGPPSGPPPANYVQSPTSLPYRGPNQLAGSGVPMQPPLPMPTGSTTGMLQSGPYPPPPSVQSLPSYGPPMGSFPGNRWQPPAPGSTPTPAPPPVVGRTPTEGPPVGQRPTMTSSGPVVSGAPQSGPPAASAPLVQPAHYQTYPPVPPQPMGSWMPPPQQVGVQMQQRSSYPTYQSNYPMTFSNHQPNGPPSQDMSRGEVPPHGVGPYASVGDPSSLPGAGSQSAKMWGNFTPYGGAPSLSPPGKDTTFDGKPPGPQLNSLSVGDHGSSDGSNNGLKSEATIGPDAWTAHKTADGAIYYYNSITGKSTYDKPPGFRGGADKVTAQPTPVSWERLSGTDWALVTTNDGKKYFYNTKTQATSWQVPRDVTELRKKQAEDAVGKASSEQMAPPGTAIEKSTVSFSLNVPAAATGGRESIGHKGLVINSALDLIKKKLQDPGAPTGSSPLPLVVGSPTVLSTVVDTTSGKAESSKEKSKGNNVDAVSSDSSSESEEEEPGPTKEERIIHFKEMLKEKGVAPFSKWEKELPKIIFDVRFKAIPSHTERRAIFEHYVRTRADEERKEKRAAQKAAVEGFKQLLDGASKDLDCNATFESFSRNWGQDPRFEALERKDREVLLNERLLPLKKAEEERVKAEHAAAVGGFKEMLLERADINTSSRWSKIRDSVRSDPRYGAVKREEREGLFNSYIGKLIAEEQEAERAAKAKREEEERLKEREREMRKRKEREEQEMDRVRVKARRKDAISSYQALLTEKIKDPEVSTAATFGA